MLKRGAQKVLNYIRRYPVMAKLFVLATGEKGFPLKYRESVAHELDRVLMANDSSASERRKRRIDILYCMLVHGISPSEYFLYGFPHLSEAGRAEYMGDLMKDMLCQQMEDKNIRKIFHDKALTYAKFKDFFKRDCIVVEGPENHDSFLAFTKKHKKYIIKAVFESRGKSIYLVDQEKEKKTDDELFAMILDMGKCLIEEYIVQGAPLCDIHRESVNTVRFATGNCDGKISLLFAELRMGCGSSYVDNAGAGGILALIDIDTGVISGIGCRENGEKYIYHPDSGFQIVGTKLPEWDSLLKLMQRLAAVVPQQKYVGWDLAYSDKGWVLVEGNHRAQMVGYQLCCGHGVRKMILDTFKMEYSMY